MILLDWVVMVGWVKDSFKFRNLYLNFKFFTSCEITDKPTFMKFIAKMNILKFICEIMLLVGFCINNTLFHIWSMGRWHKNQTYRFHCFAWKQFMSRLLKKLWNGLKPIKKMDAKNQRKKIGLSNEECSYMTHLWS